MSKVIATLVLFALVLAIVSLVARLLFPRRRSNEPRPPVNDGGLDSRHDASIRVPQLSGNETGCGGDKPAQRNRTLPLSDLEPPPKIRAASETTPPRVQASVQARVTIPGEEWYRARRAADPNALWITPEGAAEVVGYQIPGGMIYVGEGLRAVCNSSGIEPALIDPGLEIDRNAPDTSGESLGYWPSYSRISPAARRAYLSWLASGKQDPKVDIGYVFLYFYGLERRVLSDLASQEQSPEIPVIVREVERLLGIYGACSSFSGYAGSFVEYCKGAYFGTRKEYEFPPPTVRCGYELPLDLVMGLGRFVADGKPIPNDWAFAWLTLHPETYLRTPAQRCPEEFKTLFGVRYRREFGDGIIIKPNKTLVRFQYRPASPSFTGRTCEKNLSLPDVRAISGPLNRLRDLGFACCDELDAYSRLLGRNPEAKESLSAIALLPQELADAAISGKAGDLRKLIKTALALTDMAVFDAEALIHFWPVKGSERMTRGETVQFAQLLDKWGLGVEPDVRFGGKPLASGENVVLFRLPEERMQTPSRDYAAATLILHLAAVVSTSDGRVSEDEERQALRRMDSDLELTAAEKHRLRAHFRWIVATQPGLAGLRKRLEGLDEVRRAAIGEFLVGVAYADGRINREEVQVLSKVFESLALNPSALHGRLHEVMIGSTAPAVEPVTIRAKHHRAAGYAIPPESRPSAQATGVTLNMAMVHQKLVETAAVSALLGEIFAEEGSSQQIVRPDKRDDNTVTGLDASHSAFLRSLQTREAWPRSELERLAESHSLLLDGAIEVVNEAAYEQCEAPLCEGEDPVEIDAEVLRRMLA